jgi:hypothetical protein
MKGGVCDPYSHLLILVNDRFPDLMGQEVGLFAYEGRPRMEGAEKKVSRWVGPRRFFVDWGG